MSRILAGSLVAWTVLAGAIVAWARPSPAVAVILVLQGVVLLVLVYALVGIRLANIRLARLDSATTASERTAKAVRSSLQAEIGEVDARNRCNLRSDVRAGGDRVVSALGKAIQMSNRRLYRQLEALTNLNPNDAV